MVKNVVKNNISRKIFGALKNSKIDPQKFKDEIREEEKQDFERLAKETSD